MSEKLYTWHYLCDTCKYADGDGAGHFMCTDYAPPIYGGETIGPWADKLPTNGEQEPHELCLSYMNAHAIRLRGEGEGDEA